jgi:hypothetical protein
MITKQRGFIRGVGDAIAAMIIFISAVSLIIGCALGLLLGAWFL